MTQPFGKGLGEKEVQLGEDQISHRVENESDEDGHQGSRVNSVQWNYEICNLVLCLVISKKADREMK